MMKPEVFARLMVLLLVLTAASIVGFGWIERQQAPLIHARMAETGGWTPESLTAEVGKPLRLRLTSDDVTHSFAIGQSDLTIHSASGGMEVRPAVDILPGEVTEVTLTFDRPGKYTFYCTRWCSVNHWRMRGVIEVTDPNGRRVELDETGTKEPLYVTLGLNIDSPHTADVPLPETKPSARQGAQLGVQIPSEMAGREYYLSHSPAEAFKQLKAAAGLSDLPDQAIWDLVAKTWKDGLSADSIENGRQLYAANCAACHGEQGQGDGVFSAELAKPASGEHAGMQAGEMTQKPADFTGAAQMLSASPAHLQGKIIRGGMGTGMPYWGPIFTEQQTWDLVAYLWSFQFNLEDTK